MKKIILTVITVLNLASVEAQFEKGSKWIGGSLNFSVNTNELNNGNTNVNKTNGFTIGLRPSINTFKSDKIMNTFFIGYGYTGNKNKQNLGNIAKDNAHTLQVGFGKTYINPLLGKIYSSITTNIYGQYSYGKSTQNNNSGLMVAESIYNNYSANVNLSLGLMYRASDRFAVTTSLNNFLYGSIISNNQKNNSTGNPEVTSKGFEVTGGFGLSGFNLGNLQFGLMYRLKGKH